MALALVARFNQFERISDLLLPPLMAAEGIMAAKENSVKRYVVRLSADERERARSADPERKEPGTTAAESADIAEGRCLRSR